MLIKIVIGIVVLVVIGLVIRAIGEKVFSIRRR